MTTELQIPYYDQWLGPWAILPDALTQTLELFRKTDLHIHLQQQRWPADADCGSPAPEQKWPAGADRGSSRSSPSPPAPIAIIPLTGKLMKQQASMGGGTSTVQARRDIRAAADPDIGAILLRIDSPGGAAAGTKELADEIAAAKAKKPVWAYVEDMAATLAIGDGVLHPKSLESYQSAAERWGADLVAFREPLADCHFWWQKTFAIDHLLRYDHVLQIDADMLIAEDCPSPFPECDPARLGVCRDLQHPSQYRLERWLSNQTRRWSKHLGLRQPGGRQCVNAGMLLYGPQATAPLVPSLASHRPDPRFPCLGPGRPVGPLHPVRQLPIPPTPTRPLEPNPRQHKLASRPATLSVSEISAE